MADDKPKHKPQAKRTLEEVLRSLKDLVRNDLTGEHAGRAAARTAPGWPAATDEPESFNEALGRLDRIIDERIIRPARAAPAAPPTAPSEDELDIEWDAEADTTDDEGARSPAAGPEPTAQPPADAVEPWAEPEALDGAGADAEYRVEPEPDAGAERPEADASDLAALELIELAPLAPRDPEPSSETASGATQEAFSFPDAEVRAAAALDDAAPDEPEAPSAGSEDRAGGVETDDADRNRPSFLEPDRLESSWAGGTEDASSAPTFEAEPMPADSNDDAFARAHRRPATSTDDAGSDAQRPGTGTDPASPDAGDMAVNRPPEARPTPGHSPDEPGAASEPPVLEEEIPLLQDVAPGETPPAAPLPDAAHARDIAIRVIARINIERRKAGETPLDIRTIERLQRYLTEALTRAAAGRK